MMTDTNWKSTELLTLRKRSEFNTEVLNLRELDYDSVSLSIVMTYPLVYVTSGCY